MDDIRKTLSEIIADVIFFYHTDSVKVDYMYYTITIHHYERPYFNKSTRRSSR